jgi:hypothetical protein
VEENVIFDFNSTYSVEINQTFSSTNNAEKIVRFIPQYGVCLSKFNFSELEDPVLQLGS